MAQAQRVVKQTEKGDSDEVDDPAAEVRLQQVETGPFVQDGKGSQGDQGCRDQHRTEGKGELFVPEVDPGQTRAEQPADAGGNDQQADQDRDRKPEPGYGSALPDPFCPPCCPAATGSRSSGSMRVASSLTPKAPSAPFRE